MIRYLHIFLIFLLLGSLLACSEKVVEIPEETIPKDSMVMILTDIQLTESLITHNHQVKDSIDKYRVVYYESLFRKYNTNEERFNESYLFYEQHMEMLEEIHDAVITELVKRQTAM